MREDYGGSPRLFPPIRRRVLTLPRARLQSLQSRKRGLPPFAAGAGRPISATPAGAPALKETPHVRARHPSRHRDRRRRPAQLDFYTRTLGLRLVKKTVNFDDPGTYHLYYGDEAGRPGTILTFFPWEHAAPGRVGVGQTQETAFRVPKASIGYWTHRFVEKGVPHEAPEKRFGETVLPFRDPDGMGLALVGVAGAESETAWSGGEVPAEHAIRGFHGVTLLLEDAARPARS